MSNYNRAYTPKNIVNSFNESDIVEQIDTINRIWYVKTNGHEYLVNAGTIGASNAGTNLIVGSEIPLRLAPTKVMFREFIYGKFSTGSIGFNSQLTFPELKEAYFKSKLEVEFDDRGYPTDYQYSTGDVTLTKFNELINTRFPLHQYYDFNIINSNLISLFNFDSPSPSNLSDTVKNTIYNHPISCNYPKLSAELSDQNLTLSWGLPNSEVLTALSKSRAFLLSLINYSTNPPEEDIDLTIGFHTPFFVNSTSNVDVAFYKIYYRIVYAHGSSTPSIQYRLKNTVNNISVVDFPSYTGQSIRLDFDNTTPSYFGDIVNLTNPIDKKSFRVLTWYEKWKSNYKYGVVSNVDQIKISDDNMCYTVTTTDNSTGTTTTTAYYIPMITLPVATLR